MIGAEARILPDWLTVSAQTAERLGTFVELVEKWNPAINLVSKASLPLLWDRHVLDSAQIFGLAPLTDGVWADLGSGGGFPGIVVAILAAEASPGLRVVLVESDQRKATFLAQAIRTLALSTDLRCDRIEALPSLMADVVSARALAPLDGLCGYAAQHLAPGGVALFQKGAQVDPELATARMAWRFALSRHASRTGSGGVILEMRDITHV